MTRADDEPHLSLTARKTDFDEILKCIGQCGRWQRWILFWMSVVIVICAAANMSYSFIGFVQKYRCHIPSCEPADASYFVGNTTTLPDYALRTTSDVGALKRGKSCTYYASFPNETTCSVYLSALQSANTTSLGRRNEACGDTVFDTTTVMSSVMTQFGLTCENEIWIDIIASLFKVGQLFGSFFFGFLGDAYGRKVAILAGGATSFLSGMLSIFVPRVIPFALSAIGVGFGLGPLFTFPFLITLETMGPRYIVALCILIELPWAIGSILMGVEAFLVRHWVYLSLMAYVPLSLLVFIFWIVPESPRWLLTVGRTKEAERAIEKASRMNGVPFPAHLMPAQTDRELSRTDTQPTDVEQYAEPQGSTKPVASTKMGFRDLYASRVMRCRTLNLCWHWASITMSFYGLTYASVNLFGSTHMNFILSVGTEILGISLSLACIHSVGRQRLLTAVELCGGASCILSGLLTLIQTDEGTVHVAAGHTSTILAFVGKTCSSAAFTIIYLYTAELYPTAMRSTAVGTCCTVGRIGGVCAYLISLLRLQWAATPTVVYGTCSLLAGFLVLALPETAGLPIPETLEEATTIKARSKKRVRGRFPRSFRELVTDPEFAE